MHSKRCCDPGEGNRIPGLEYRNAGLLHSSSNRLLADVVRITHESPQYVHLIESQSLNSCLLVDRHEFGKRSSSLNNYDVGEGRCRSTLFTLIARCSLKW